MGIRLCRSTVVCLTLALVASGAVRAGLAHAYVFRISVTNSPITRPLPRGFLGVGLEYNTIPRWFEPANPVLVQLIRNLSPAGHPVVRIGGQSTDRSWWPVAGMRRPLGVTYDLGPGWTTAARAFAQALAGRLMLGVNLEANRTRIDEVEGAELVRRIGRRYISALTIGNEPLLYTLVPWYRELGGRPLPWYSHKGTAVHARSRSYGPLQFASEFARTLAVLPHLPIADPETGNPQWLNVFRRFLYPRSQVRTLTSHAYGLNSCVTNRASPDYPSIAHLLAPHASRGLADAIAPYIALAHRDGGTYRIDEMGSVSCNGYAGVSNTMASALWVMDSLFWIASRHIDGVNLHTYQNSINGLFDFSQAHGGQWEGAVHPLYYGLLMFEHAAPAGSRLLQIVSDNQLLLRAWATRGRDGRVRVLLINDSVDSKALALVRAPSGYRSRAGGLERLLAPSAYATAGITIGGRTFGSGTSTGALAPPLLEQVVPRRGTYRVLLAAGSAALLTL